MCNIFETIQGVGCSIVKTKSGNGWLIVVDGYTSDVEFPSEYPVAPTGGGYTDGEERWGRVIYDTSVDPPLLGQYTETWNAATSTWDESETYTTIHTPTSHNAAHGVDD
jgi:hypothetical protein